MNRHDAGLEVVPPRDQSPEVYSPTASAEVNHPVYTGPYPVVSSPEPSYRNYAQPSSAYGGSTVAWDKTTPQQATPTLIPVPGPGKAAGDGKSSRRKLLFLLGAGLAVVVAGIVGGIVGWQVTDGQLRGRIAELEQGNKKDPTADPRAPAQNDVSGANLTIRAGSAISATGYRYSEGYQLRVFYQGPDNVMRYSEFDSLYGAWSNPVKLNGVKYAPASDTPLAASVLFHRLGSHAIPLPFYTLIYGSDSNKLIMQDWRDGYGLVGTTATTFTNMGRTILPGRKIAYLWPQLIWNQGDLGNAAITSLYYETALNETRGIWEYKSWNQNSNLKSVSVGALSEGSPLVVLPLTPSYSGQEARMVYRNNHGRLALFDRQSDGTTHETTLPLEIPDRTSMTGFATGTASGTGVSAKLLWRDGGVIKILSQDNGSGEAGDSERWSGPVENQVFEGADADTQLACITAGVTTREKFNEKLSAGNELNSCFFQKNGALKHVHYNGDRWTDRGAVPMPAA